ALELTRAGFDVVATATQIESNEEVAAALREAGGNPLLVNVNLTSADSIKEAFARVLTEKGRVDVLVNNAGITRDGLAVRMKTDDWNNVLQVNLTGTFLVTRQVLPGMMRNRWGRIINISSVVGQAGSAGQANYAAAKAGIIGMSKALAQEVASR